MSDMTPIKCPHCQRSTFSGEHGPGECDPTIVDLAICVGAECSREHGVRLATRRGYGPASAYILCDECFETRLEGEAKPLMREVRGAAWVREIELHALHRGQFPKDGAAATRLDAHPLAPILEEALAGLSPVPDSADDLDLLDEIANEARDLDGLAEPEVVRAAAIRIIGLAAQMVAAIDAQGQGGEAGR